MGAHHESLAERIDAFSIRHPHMPVLRTLMRSPIVSWRLGLGPLLGRFGVRGGHLVMLTVTGRSSGLPRHTPVTAHVVGDETYLWCPYGGRSEWYRNVKANPLVTVQSRGNTQVMRAVAIEDVDDVMRVVADLRQFDETFLRSYLAAEGIADTPEDIARNRTRTGCTFGAWTPRRRRGRPRSRLTLCGSGSCPWPLLSWPQCGDLVAATR